jgi:hypothetical protein
MSNATFANRVAFQTSTVNGQTNLHLLPNGTNTASTLTLEGDSAVTNGATFSLQNNPGGSGEVRVVSGARGTGSYLPMTFYTGGSEKMRIDTSGNVMVGQTALSAITVGVGINPAGLVNIAQNNSTSGGTGIQIYSTAASAFRFYVNMAGTVFATNTTISAISDQRYKENIRDLDVGLDAVMQLRPRKFDWKEGKGQDTKDCRGFIAQEFEQVFPDLLDTWKDPAPEGEEPYKSVRQDLIPVLVKAIQELSAKNDALEARIAALEGAQA